MLSLKEIKILSSEQTKNRILCKNCGHGKLLGKQDEVICDHCGNFIFKDDETEFKYRLRQNLIKQKKQTRTT